MGDGGVACIPAHDIMVKFPVVSDSFCGGGGGGGSSGGGGNNVNNNNSCSNSNNESNGKLDAKPIKITGTKRMKLKRDAFFKKEEPPVQVKKDEVGGQTGENEEVEEGELGTMISPKKEMPSSDGLSTVEKVLKGGSEKGEVDAVKERKVEQVNGEVLPAKKRKGKAKKKGKIGAGSLRSDAVTRRERSPDFQWRRERSPDFVPRRKRSPEFSWRRERSPSFNAGWRNRSPDKYSKGISKRDEALSPVGADDDEIERGEFIPDEFHNGELSRDDHSNNHRRDGSRDSDRRNAFDYTPPPGKYSVEDISPGRKSGNQHRKRPARSEAHQDKNHLKMNLKADEVSSYKNDPNHGNNHWKEHSSSASRLKRHDTDSEGDVRKHYEDHSDYVSSKSRRLSGDSFRSARTEHLSNRSVESSGKDPPSSRINSERQCLRRYDSYSSRTNDSHGRSSPYHSERSPHDRARYRDHRERTPVMRERSPDRGGRNHYHRNQTPNNSTRSPESGPRAHDRRNQSPSVLEGSQHDRKRSNNSDQATSSQLESKETRQNQSSLEKEVKDRDTNRRSSVSAKEPESGRNLDNESVHKNLTCHADKESHHEIPSIPSADQHLQEDGTIEELPSMEEDMDICDTPPHVPAAVSIDPGKWFYLDYFGVERGPSRLCDLKTLVDGGFLATDHFIKHIDSDRWMTVENAASPLVTLNFSTVVPDDVSQLVSPPEAAGNLLTDTMDAEHANDTGMDAPVALEQRITCSSENSDVSDVSVDLRIVERVDALMEDISILPGKELEILGEILKTTFSHPGHEIWNIFEDTGDTVLFPRAEDLSEQNGDAPPGFPDKAPADAAEPTSSAGIDVDGGQLPAEFNEWFSCRWSCRGGDWRKNDDGVQDKYFKKKIVLNDGYSLCQMSKSEYEDPRSSEIDDLYSTSQSSKFELPVWAFSWPDEQFDYSISGKPGQAKVALPKGVKGTMLPVVRINACVVNEHDSSSSDARLRNRGKDRYPSKFVRPCPSPGDNIRSNTEDSSHLNHRKDDFDCTPINVSNDHILIKDELQLHLGGWYFLDGAGRENGPFPLSQLHLLVDQGLIQKCSSVFRKIDNVWVPVTSAIGAFQNTNKLIEDHRTSVNDSSGALLYPEEGELRETNIASSSVHDTYPQFIGYTRGKLHELVMRFYKSREFAAAINEVLDPWINARQPKKESEKHPYRQKAALESESSLVHQGHLHTAKRARLMAEGSGEEYEMENNSRTFLDDFQPFEDLCGNVSFFESKAPCSKVMDGSWGLLDGHILARIFHFLRGDTRSLVFAYYTCKHWREAVGFYRGISRLVNLSSIGNKCTDSIFRSIMGGYDEGKIRSLVLVGCSNISSGILEDILRSFSCISFIDIRGCAQLDELTIKFSNLNWVTGHSVQSTGTFENSYFRIPSSKQMADEISSASRSSIGSSYMDDSSGLEVYFDMVDKKRDAANQAFRQSLYKRSKLYDARRSLSILAREAHMRRWAMKKPGNGYKRTEEFLLNSLKEITQDKTYEFFVPRVTEIEGRIKSGYYASRGIAYVKEDINKMCKDAKKMRNRDSGDMHHIIKMLNKLSAGLEANSRRVIDKDQMMKTLKDDSVGISKHKKHSKPKTDRKKMSRSNSSSITYGGPDYMECSDRESGRRLSKSKLKSVESGTDSSDEFEASSDDAGSNSDSMGSETESDLDMRTDVGFADSRAGYVISDEDSMTDDREWGARMTKASLVPPVTRKYEVIEEYVIVADEDEVSRKMRVSLPDDYVEKVKAQKNGVEESDMEIPEVKEFKPRKQLGDEVIEQEVFGIDPYTHNLLLDSMPDDEDWSIPEKHIFIEDVLLRTLNKQVRHFTGSGNTPMVYTLKPVLEEIIEKVKKDRDLKKMKLCQAILDAINRRPDDNYVAYRKGLGVVCNKEGGFGGDDFVVEFLGEVYPAWKWFEKQDGIRSLQKNSKDTAPEFYNINLERPKGDADGYDLVVVDAMHKANYASRICHSCRPNCEAKVTAVDGYYQIGIYTVRPIGFGEEVTFDYNSVTESKEEYEASVCLCGSQVCRGSYLNLVGEGAFLKVLKEWHGLLDRHRLMLEACELNWVSEEDYIDLSRAGLGSCLLGGLPDWLIAYSARLVRFINFERTKLPDEILRHNVEEKKKYFADICYEVEKSDAEIQAEGVYNQRLQNLALTLDKVRYVMRCAFGDPKKAPPPIRKLRPEEMVSFLWKGSGSFVEELLQCIGPHMEDGVLDTLRSKIRSHDPSGSDDVERELQKSLVWLRDEVRNLQCTHKCRHDAAADLIHIYAYTKSFFKIREYKAVTSPPVHISPLDLGPKCADKISGLTEYRKTYGENYCLGQLIYWYNQANADPDRKLARASRGCLSLPDIGSFYAKAQKPARQRVYGPRTVRFMTARMEKQPQRPWPEDRIWSFKTSPKVFGSPMLDAVLNNSPLERDMVNWLKNRPAVYHALSDR